MATSRVNLDETQYVRVTSDPFKPSSLLMQSHRDTVRIAFSEVKPAKGNPVFHELGGEHSMLQLPMTVSSVWALAMTDRSSLTVTDTVLPDLPPRTTFGEVSVESKSPVVQIKSQSGLLNDVLTLSDDASTGIATITDGMYTCESGTDVDSFSSILTKRHVTQKAGQGALGIVSTKFDTPVVGNDQLTGLITNNDALGFAYVGTTFGIAHVRDGKGELQELTITTPAAGSETATVTINGVGYPVNLTGNGVASEDAYEISLELNSVVPNFVFSSNGDTVCAQGELPQIVGAFAYSSATSIGTWEQLTQASVADVIFTPQTAWNVDTRISTNGDVNLDPLKGNSYKIQYGDGFSDVIFSIEDKMSGDYVVVHKMRYANSSTRPNLTNSSLRAGWLTRNTGGTTNVILQGVSASLFNEGERTYSTPPRSIFSPQLGVTDVKTSLLTIRNRKSFNGKENRAELKPLKISMSTQANKFMLFEVVLNPVFASPINYEYFDKENSIIEFSKDKTTVSGGITGGSLVVVAGQARRSEFNGTDFIETIIFPGQVACVTGANGAGGVGEEAQVTVLLLEDL